MDKLEERLTQDAGLVRADVPPELRARIDASLQHSSLLPPRAHKDPGLPLWLTASLSGAAAAVLIVVWLNRDAGGPARPDSMAAAGDAPRAVPGYVSDLQRRIPLQVKEVELTAPLEDELGNLRADMRKARDEVRQDLDFSL